MYSIPRRFARLSCFLGLAVLAPGCCTKLGYFPEQLKTSSAAPEYGEVRRWALQVADGYDSRHTSNRYALYFGALTAAAGAGAMAGLAAFAPGSSAIIGIPIGTTFLGGSMAIFNSEPRALIYDRGARAIKDMVTLSDCRKAACTAGAPGCPATTEALCLHRDVDALMRRVSEHITYLDPKNVTDTLKAVATSAEAKRAKAAKSEDVVGMQKKRVADLVKQQANVAAAASKATPGSDEETKLKKKAADLTNAVDAATKIQTDAETVRDDAKKQADDATDSLLEKTLQTTSLDSTDLQTVVTTCPVPVSCERVKVIVVDPDAQPAAVGH